MAGPFTNDVEELVYWLDKITDCNYPYFDKIKEQKNLWFVDNSKTVYEDIIKFLDSKVS